MNIFMGMKKNSMPMEGEMDGHGIYSLWIKTLVSLFFIFDRTN